MTIYYPPEQNAIQKTLDAQLLAGITASMTLSNVTGIPNKAGVCVIDLVDANGAFTPAKREYVSYTGVSGSTLTGLTRNADGGGSDQDHAVGAIVQFPADVLQQQGFLDSYLTEHEEAGTHKAATVTTLKATGTEVNTGTEDAKIVTPKALADSDYAKTSDITVTADSATTFTNKTITSTTNLISFNSPRGFLINGKIVPSVANNDLIVAIKGLDGNDPSATNPVYCRIGDTIRSITSALSVTCADGTNWFNSGCAELATKEIDYFTYLGYNATDGVVLGFSRIPSGKIYSDFSSTNTNEKYCAISIITNAAAGDAYENIGRFAATLSAGAGYTWTVPTFTNLNLIQRPIFETRILSFTGAEYQYFASTTTKYSSYQIVNDKINIEFARIGTMSATPNNPTTTVPFAPKNYDSLTPVSLYGYSYDTSVNYVNSFTLINNNRLATFYRYVSGSYANGNVYVYFSGSYFI